MNYLTFLQVKPETNAAVEHFNGQHPFAAAARRNGSRLRRRYRTAMQCDLLREGAAQEGEKPLSQHPISLDTATDRFCEQRDNTGLSP
jgi:hypothetical protein